jgi:hemolysin III
MYAGERFNGYSHLLGLALALAGAWFLVAKAGAAGDAARTFGAAVFALSMVALYAVSTLFHSTRGPRKSLWRRADHCAIYLLIAGSFTPFALAALKSDWVWALLGLLWALTLLGMAREIRSREDAPPSPALYLALGWLCVLAAIPLAARLHGAALAWLLAGAAFYTGGMVFYRNRGGWRHAHGTWHLCVLGGTASHYIALACFVL